MMPPPIDNVDPVVQYMVCGMGDAGMDGRRGRQKGDGPAAIEINIGGTFMGVSENARLVLEKRYLIKDADGKAIESVDGMFQRVAGRLRPPTCCTTKTPTWSGPRRPFTI